MIKLSIKVIKDNPNDSKYSFVIIDHYDDGKVIESYRTHYIFAVKINRLGAGRIYTNKPSILGAELYTRGLPMFDEDTAFNPTLENHLFLSQVLKLYNLRFNRKKGVFIKNGKEINNKSLI